MLVLSKGNDDHEATWAAYERTVRYGEGWEPTRRDVDVLVMEDVGEDDVRAVVGQPGWAALTGVRIKAFSLSDATMASLVADGAFRHVRHLDLHACYRIGDRTMAALARHAPALTTLCVDWSDVTDEGLAAILAEGGPPLERVRGIHLKRVTEQGLLAAYHARVPNQWISAPAEPEPEPSVLRARHDQAEGGADDTFGDDSLGWGDFPAERVFDNEDWDREWPSAVAEIAALPPGFAVFRYQKQDPTAAQLVQLLGAPLMRDVRYLDLRRNHRLADEDLASALRAVVPSDVELLCLDACYAVGARTVEAIVACLPNLRGLDLGQTAIGDAELMALAALPALRRVQGAFMEAGLTRDGVAAFQAARPDVSVRFTWA